MTTAKDRQDERKSLIKLALFILVFLSLVVSIVFCMHGKSNQVSLLATNFLTKFNGDGQAEIALRPATPADYAYYLEVYPDLEIDQPPGNEAVWNRRDLPTASIITRGAQPVGYIWVLKYDVVYYLEYFVIGRVHRGKGIGTKALESIKAHARELGYSRWGLDCDINHHIPYKMYTKAGMGKVGEVYHLKAPYHSSLAGATTMSVMIVNDPEQWPILEEKYGLIKGRARFFFPSGIVPVLLLDANGQTRGFTIFSPSDFRLLSPIVDSSEDLMVFLDLLQDLKTADETSGWMHFWVDRGEEYARAILSYIPGAVLCEQYDMLEGSTSE